MNEDLSSLIDSITPKYNFHKDNSAVSTPVESIEIMWEIGDLLLIYLKKTKMAPHTLYREIYGKSEGTKNISQRSYITREFLGRCYRVRLIFNQKEDILKLLPNLKSFTAFRESMPFFDNEKYKLYGAEREQLLILLNSDLPTDVLNKKLKALRIERIGVKNPRTQKLSEIEPYKEIFIQFYNYIYDLSNKSDDEIKQVLNDEEIDREFLISISKSTNSLTAEGLDAHKVSKTFVKEGMWMQYMSLLEYFTSKDTEKERRRLRRLVPPTRISKLSEMIYMLSPKADSK